MFSPFRVIATTVLVAAVGLSGAVGAAAQATDDRSVRELADSLDMSFGIAVDGDSLGDDHYDALVAANANTISTRAELSFAVTQPTQGTFDFAAAEAIVDFAVEHDLAVRGHDLIAPDRLPAWITDGTWDAATLTGVLTEHVTTVIAHFHERNPGVITDWDVAARAVQADGTARESVLHSVLGDAWLDIAFDAARAADADATLFYGDFFDDASIVRDAALAGQPIVPGADASRSTCDLVAKCVGVSALVQTLQAQGTPIDGVGFEARLFSAEPMDFAQFHAWVDDLGLEWAVTEFDVPLPATETATAEMLEYQADTYRAALTACLDAPSCDTFVTWGISDRYSPLPAETGGVYDGALWFDADDQPKPAYTAIRGVLAERAGPPTPTTTEPAPSDADAMASERAPSPEADDSSPDAGAGGSSVVAPALIGGGALLAVAAVVFALRRRSSPAR